MPKVIYHISLRELHNVSPHLQELCMTTNLILLIQLHLLHHLISKINKYIYIYTWACMLYICMHACAHIYIFMIASDVGHVMVSTE